MWQWLSIASKFFAMKTYMVETAMSSWSPSYKRGILEVVVSILMPCSF